MPGKRKPTSKSRATKWKDWAAIVPLSGGSAGGAICAGAYLRVPACSGCGVASARPGARCSDSTWRARGSSGFRLGRRPDPPPSRREGVPVTCWRLPPTPVAKVSRGGSPMGGACYGPRVCSQKRTPGGLAESNRPVPARCQAARSLWAMAARGS
ncbi:hypothetical protein HPB52_022286 [Rhipicephalus sanguineus]|uniref:Uncharacterized protein n=1 Tax=Rhipicephalus sanguineus TaxID=34632 RepID=A0A9D4TBW1_RHISA|nr:hypothetical protein HPB52_022286 [Rhipicephalus sanguineus]